MGASSANLAPYLALLSAVAGSNVSCVKWLKALSHVEVYPVTGAWPPTASLWLPGSKDRQGLGRRPESPHWKQKGGGDGVLAGGAT